MKTIYTEEEAKTVRKRIKNKKTIANQSINNRRNNIYMIEEQKRLMELFQED